ncbi:hypothetical protein SH139x_003694 [Planctomycetaceae bacterium SH139]
MKLGQTQGGYRFDFLNHPSESAGVRPDGKDRCLKEGNGKPAGRASGKLDKPRRRDSQHGRLRSSRVSSGRLPSGCH